MNDTENNPIALPRLPCAYYGTARQTGCQTYAGSWFTERQMREYAEVTAAPLLELIEEQRRTIAGLMVVSGDETLPVIKRIGELERDAERYAFLREYDHFMNTEVRFHCDARPSLDAAVDAAIEAERVRTA